MSGEAGLAQSLPLPDHAALIAQACHEAMRAYNELIGDPVLERWADATESHRASMIAGVLFTASMPSATLAEQHAAWVGHKVTEGWIRGPVRDEAKREHPSLVPWSELPDAQKMKNGIFRAITFAMWPALAYAYGGGFRSPYGEIETT